MTDEQDETDGLKDIPDTEPEVSDSDRDAEKEQAAIKAKKYEPPDYTGIGPVADRVLAINFGFFRYGTSDRFQGAAIMLALFLLLLIAALVGTSLFIEIEDVRFDKVFAWLGSAFLLVTGVAIGRAASKKED